MEKTIKINLAGIIFQISENGYGLLKDYLQSITNRLKNYPDGNEMIDDIEARIAEIFQSGPTWKTGVISKEEVEEMISTMGSADDIADGLESDESYEKFRSTGERRLYRDTNHSILGGVCSGLGNYLRIETIWIRIAFVLLTLFYLSGLLIYGILWIALPRTTQLQDSERIRSSKRTGRSEPGEVKNTGNVLNDLFMLLGKVIIVFFRVILAIIGITFILTGFGLLVSYIAIAFFNVPVIGGAFYNVEFFNLTNLLSFVVSPGMAPLIMILMSMAVILPLAGIIYWGIRMVFQFRAKDLILNIVMFSIWIVASTILAVLLFSEGVSFANRGQSYEQIAIPSTDTLIISVNKTLSEGDYDRSVSVPSGPTLYLNNTDKTIYGIPEVSFRTLDENAPYVQIVKSSQGKSRLEATKKADNLKYDYDMQGNKLSLDQYFTIPSGNRWSGATLNVKIYIPEGKIIYIDENIESILDGHPGKGVYSWETGGRYWRVTSWGLEESK